jgi:hypothetical protein
MVFRLSRSYDLNVARERGSAVHPGSDILGEIYLRTPKAFSLSATGSYNAYDHAVSSHTETVSFAESAVSLRLAHTFIQGAAESLTGEGGLTLSRWKLQATVSRDIQNKKNTQEEYIVHYTSQCWGLSLTYIAMPGDYSYKAMIDLKGLGSRGAK